MPYCIELSNIDHSRQRIVSGPWEGECQDCSFPSSSSSGSDFFACLDGECVALASLNEDQLSRISLGPFFGADDCDLCVDPNSSSSSELNSSSSSGILSCLECDPAKKTSDCVDCCCWSLPMMTDDGIQMVNVPRTINLNSNTIKRLCAEWGQEGSGCEVSCFPLQKILLQDECEDREELIFDAFGNEGCLCKFDQMEVGTEIKLNNKIVLWKSEGCDTETQTPINPRWNIDDEDNQVFIPNACGQPNQPWRIWVEDRTETDTKGEKTHSLKLRIDNEFGPGNKSPISNYCESFIWKKSCDGDYCESSYKFVIIRDDSTTVMGLSDEKIVLSKDCNFWKTYTSPTEGIVAVASDQATGGSTVVILAHRNSGSTTETISLTASEASMEGVSWNEPNLVSSFPSCGRMTYGQGRFLSASKALGGAPAKSMVSFDGNSWSLHDMDAPYGADDIAWGLVSGLGKYLAVRSVNSLPGAPGIFQQFSVSNDGENWTGLTAPEFNRWKRVVYGNGRFVALAMGESDEDSTWDGKSPKFAVSQDLVNWTLANAPGDGSLNLDSVVLSSTDDEDSKYHFVMMAGGQNGLFAYGSDDGINWEIIETPVAVPLQDFGGPSEFDGFAGNEYWSGEFSGLTYYRHGRWIAGVTVKSTQSSPDPFEINKMVGWDGCWSYGDIDPAEPYTIETCLPMCLQGTCEGTTFYSVTYLEDDSWRRSGIQLSTRYRREYGDYTLKEYYDYNTSHNLSSEPPLGTAPFNGIAESQEVEFSLEFNPTCRQPDTQSFCGSNCLGELYNFIDIETLDSYPMPPEECAGNKNATYNGRPLDIDITCGEPGEGEGDEVPGGVIMYFSPYANTVPVINNLAYDTLSLPPAPPGKINVVLVKRTKTRNELRQWVCENLKFATVRDDWRTDPVTGSGSIGSDFTSPEQNVNFNWPYNDLYFSICPGGNVVNLVPC